MSHKSIKSPAGIHNREVAGRGGRGGGAEGLLYEKGYLIAACGNKGI